MMSPVVLNLKLIYDVSYFTQPRANNDDYIHVEITYGMRKPVPEMRNILVDFSGLPHTTTPQNPSIERDMVKETVYKVKKGQTVITRTHVTTVDILDGYGHMDIKLLRFETEDSLSDDYLKSLSMNIYNLMQMHSIMAAIESRVITLCRENTLILKKIELCGKISTLRGENKLYCIC